MVVICKAGGRRGMICAHKCNQGDDIVTCAINATLDRCCFAEPEAAFKARQSARLKAIGGG